MEANAATPLTATARHVDETSRLIDVGGRRLAFASRGEGAPVVVLETGLGAESRDWAAVSRGVARFTRVIRYDRAGRGDSDPAPAPRDARDLVDDLHALLGRAEIRGPCVMVGHSLGGLITRCYADRHGHNVAGLVLVDGMHEDQFDVFAPHYPPEAPGEPAPVRAMRKMWTGGWRDPASTVERLDLVASTAWARRITGFGDLPLHVLSAGTFLTLPIEPPGVRADLQRRWDALQRSFLRLSSSATRTVIETSGHFMQRDVPDAIVGAIRDMVTMLREKRSP